MAENWLGNVKRRGDAVTVSILWTELQEAADDEFIPWQGGRNSPLVGQLKCEDRLRLAT